MNQFLFPVQGQWQLSQLHKPTHDAWDIIGVPDRYPDLVAPEDCEVVRSQYSRHRSNWPLDNWVILKGAKYYWYMGHMRSRSVKVGDRVKAGQKIGVMGNTGKSSGPHCHLEVRLTRTGKGIDPYTVYKNIMRWGNNQPSTSARTYLTYTTVKPQPPINPLQATVNQLTSQLNNANNRIATMEAEIANYRTKLSDLTVALENANNKPPVEIVKEVEKIVEIERIVEIETPIDVTDQAFWVKLWTAVKNFAAGLIKNNKDKQ